MLLVFLFICFVIFVRELVQEVDDVDSNIRILVAEKPDKAGNGTRSHKFWIGEDGHLGEWHERAKSAV